MRALKVTITSDDESWALVRDRKGDWKGLWASAVDPPQELSQEHIERVLWTALSGLQVPEFIRWYDEDEDPMAEHRKESI